MITRLGVSAIAFLLSISVLTSCSWAQQTLGAITGQVSDTYGRRCSPDTLVTAVGDQTGLTRTAKTNDSGGLSLLEPADRNILTHVSCTRDLTHRGFRRSPCRPTVPRPSMPI